MQADNLYARREANNGEMEALIGKFLGKFRIVERIGVGGMATVFKAYQSNLDRYVAIKVLPAYHASDPVFVERFEQEAKSVAKLAHPNIVQLHDFGEENGITYIVMEYVDGGTLKERIKKPLSVAEAAEYIIQAAEGLDCAHRKGIVHRDVKPANMLLRTDGHLLISDFGIAKILEGTSGLTRTGTGIGTPQYMSPEQGMGRPVDKRSDIYSLGIVLFHCLTGRVPFTADSPLTITVKHMQDPLPVDKLTAERVPEAIIRVVQQMTAKQPHERYQSMVAFIDALSNALAISNVPLARSGRLGGSNAFDFRGVVANQAGPSAAPSASAPGPAAQSGPNVSAGPAGAPEQAAVTLVCFRCGAHNPSTRLYCTTCGDDLSNKRASEDRYLGPNGQPVYARLMIQNGPMGGRAYRFHQDMTTIGRINGNDFVISGRTVSRRHARLWFDRGSARWYLEDLQSANGTFVNNTRIFQPVPLNDGDIINLGDEVVVFNILS